MEQSKRMKIVVLVAAVSLSMPISGVAAQTTSRAQRTSPAAPPVADKVAEAYTQFLLGHSLEEDDKVDAAIAAFKRAMELDPSAAEIPAELAGLYLRQSKIQEALTTADQALKISAENAEANRVLGIVYAALAEGGRENAARGGASSTSNENLAKAIRHLEAAIAHPEGQPDPNVRATLARLYIRSGAFDKAIPLLVDLVKQEPGWGDGPLLLAEAYAGSGRAKDAIAWLETQDDPRLLPTLGDFYERERRWSDAADAYGRALKNLTTRNPRAADDLKSRYASSLMRTGKRDDVVKARDVLTELVSARTSAPPDARTLYLLSQAQRRLGQHADAEATARRLIAQNTKNPFGYYALAEALEQARKFQKVVDELAPVVAEHRGKSDQSFDIGMLLPHLGFAYQELGQVDKAIATFEEARRLAPKDPNVASYLVEANIAAKKYSAAADLARAARTDNPDDLRLARLEAQALRHAGRGEAAVTLLEQSVRTHADDPTAHIALAQLYSELERGPQAVRVLQEAKAKFPDDSSIVFELGAAYDKQKNFPEAEAAFKQLIAREPDNSAALNYLGYMLAERGERLDESVDLVKRALQIEPDNGSYLDSLGWAYFKADKLDLAESSLRKAADQMRSNSVIQDHYGEVLFKMQRYDDAIAAWTRALGGDGDSINRTDIDRKIRTAKQKLPKK
jgi:tetratricopeptide (TPR) repeat protein